jgi:hypothetical protein
MYGGEPAGMAGRSDGGGGCAGVARWRSALPGPGNILLRAVRPRGRYRRDSSGAGGEGRELEGPGGGALILLDELGPVGMMFRGDQMVSRADRQILLFVMVRWQTRTQRAQKRDEEGSSGRTDRARASHVTG